MKNIKLAFCLIAIIWFCIGGMVTLGFTKTFITDQYIKCFGMTDKYYEVLKENHIDTNLIK